MQMVILSGIVIVLSIFLYVQLEHQTANCLSAIFKLIPGLLQFPLLWNSLHMVH